MLVAFIIVAVIAIGLAVGLFMAQQRITALTEERDEANRVLNETTVDLHRANERLETAEGQIKTLEGQRADLTDQNQQLTVSLDETATTLRKRTELADAQAMQIDSLSAARDELQQQLNSAEERIVTLAARPGVVVGELTNDDANAEMLWDLEVARSERAWRNSVAINPVDDPSPFESTDDPVHTAVQIEASALREDVGALIEIDWRAKPIEAASRRLLVVRVAQEMLALASRAPGAAKLVVTHDGDDEGELKMEFEAADESAQVINLIPPQISNELIDVRSESGLSLTVKAE
jgi:small-conductance mechanosensitive channel